MAGTIEQKLAAQGIVLPEPRAAMANYVGFVRTGNLLFVSGQVCAGPEGKLIAKGKLGAGVTTEQGYHAAQSCAVNLLAQVKAALGDLDKVVRVVRLGGFVNSAPDYFEVAFFCEKVWRYSPPSRRTVATSSDESAFTTDEPTPCKPPEWM